MGVLYNISTYLFLVAIHFATIFNAKARLWVKGRKSIFKKLEQTLSNTENIVWFHCASLGEYDMALPLIEACVAADPSVEIVVSFYSPSGMQHYHKRGFEPHAVFYLPADLPGQMRRLVKAVGAARLYVPKYEFWPNLLKEAHKAQVAIYSVSTMLRSSQVYFKWYGGFFRKALQCVTYFGVQNQQTQQLLLTIGIEPEKIEILGDLRFNRVLAAKATAKPNALIEQFVGASPLLILGSSWPAEEGLFVEILQKKPDALEQFKILIAPHDLSKGHLNQLKTQFPTAVFYSEHENSNLAQYQILILDTIGHLSAAYQYGAVAFVGGGFSGSLHNILEPLAYGLPVLFGPKHEKFPEAQQFIDLGFAQVVETAKGLDQILLSLMENQKEAQAIIESKVFKLQVNISAELIS
mgnify:CR=1 FL=1